MIYDRRFVKIIFLNFQTQDVQNNFSLTSTTKPNSFAGRRLIRRYANDSSGTYPEHFTVNLPALSPTMEWEQ